MTNKECIRIRKSTRKYLPTLLDEATLLQIKEYCSNLKPLFNDIKISFDILTRNNIKTILPINSPHYISIYSEPKEGYLENVGFMFQQLDLYLSSLGIGSCWLGMGKPSEMKYNSTMEYIIMISFGKANGNPHRENSEFNRKSLSEIANVEDTKLEAARLAPSATNSQPWYFVKEDDEYHVFCIKQNIVKKLLLEKMNKIDMGIVLASLYTEFEDTFKFKKIKEEPTKEGYTYVGSITL